MKGHAIVSRVAECSPIALFGDVHQSLQYPLGLGIFSVSYSILALMRAERLLALPVTLFSVFVGYAARARFEADFFLVLFGAAVATSTAVGWFTCRREERQD
jgi:hypothetical protein